MITFSISYESDLDLAKKVIKQEALNHPKSIDFRTETEKKYGEDQIVVRVVKLGESSVDLKAWVWVKDQSDGFILECDLLESVKKHFDNEVIGIPYPHRTIVKVD